MQVADKQADIRYQITPRLVSHLKAARRLGMTQGAFQVKLRELIGAGFPRPCPITGNFDLKAIDQWIDLRTGVTSRQGADVVIRQRLNDLG